MFDFQNLYLAEALEILVISVIKDMSVKLQLTKWIFSVFICIDDISLERNNMLLPDLIAVSYNVQISNDNYRCPTSTPNHHAVTTKS